MYVNLKYLALRCQRLRPTTDSDFSLANACCRFGEDIAACE
ncbi:hypothetical protein GGE67_001963 [Rhizobium leucaenae]|nr:hypothetical protein [Rhizobium leucaenae]